jgi:hypothetical protein
VSSLPLPKADVANYGGGGPSAFFAFALLAFAFSSFWWSSFLWSSGSKQTNY